MDPLACLGVGEQRYLNVKQYTNQSKRETFGVKIPTGFSWTVHRIGDVIEDSREHLIWDGPSILAVTHPVHQAREECRTPFTSFEDFSGQVRVFRFSFPDP